MLQPSAPPESSASESVRATWRLDNVEVLSVTRKYVVLAARPIPPTWLKSHPCPVLLTKVALI